jgi:hypothetical protein
LHFGRIRSRNRRSTIDRRIVDRRLALEGDEREHFRMLMRMCEKLTGCRVLSYCLMSKHSHILQEVPPMPEGGQRGFVCALWVCFTASAGGGNREGICERSVHECPRAIWNEAKRWSPCDERQWQHRERCAVEHERFAPRDIKRR